MASKAVNETIFCIHQWPTLPGESKTGFFCCEHLADGRFPECRYSTLEELKAGQKQPYPCWFEPVVKQKVKGE